MTRGEHHTKRVGGQQPGRPRPPTPQEARQRLKVRALRSLEEVEDEALDTTRDAVQWRRNQEVWIRLLVQGPSRMMLEVVTTFGAPEPMTH